MTIALTSEGRTVKFGRYTGPASYVTGGDAIAASDFALSRLDHLVISGGTESGYVLAYDPSAGKIKWFIADYSTTTDAPLIEAASDTDLDAEVCDVIAIGLP